MFPISNENNPARRTAIVTLGFIVVNVLVFLYELSLGVGVENFVRLYGAVPREILTGQDVPPPGPHPLWIQLFTSMFIHGGWLHIIGNMAYLRVFGDDIEDAFGHLRFLIFYLGAGIGASLVHISMSGALDTMPSIGASGAIAGVMGAYIVLFPTRRVQVFVPPYLFGTFRVSALILLGFWFILQFVNEVIDMAGGIADAGGVAVWAHIGGFLIGALFALVAGWTLGGAGGGYRAARAIKF